MEAPVYSSADVEETTKNSVTTIAVEDIDATFRSDCIGTHQPHQTTTSDRLN